MKLTRSDIDGLNKRYRAHLINSLSGFKSATLIGTRSKDGCDNLGVFNSIVHIGANPPLLGFIMRPHTVERHTLENILNTGYFTFNHITAGIYKQAHWSSAKFDRAVSEFEAVGLSTAFSDVHDAPYVEESSVKIGLRFKQQIPISLNQTSLIIGEVIEIDIPEIALSDDGYLNLDQAGTLAIGALDGYYKSTKIARLAYARTEELPKEIDGN